MVHKPVSVQYKSSYEEAVQRTLVISITFIAIQVLNLSSVSGNYIYVEVKNSQHMGSVSTPTIEEQRVPRLSAIDQPMHRRELNDMNQLMDATLCTDNSQYLPWLVDCRVDHQ